MLAINPNTIKHAIILAVIAIVIFASCVEEYNWAEDGPSQNDIRREALQEAMDTLMARNGSFYGLMVLVMDHPQITAPRDSILLYGRTYTNGDTVQTITCHMNSNDATFYKKIEVSGNTIAKYKRNLSYNAFGNPRVGWYRHPENLSHLDGTEGTLALIIDSNPLYDWLSWKKYD